MEREVAANIAFAAGRRDEALAILRAAAQDEAALPAPLGLPEPIKPAPELLGELLVDTGRAGEADAFFEAALRRNPKRSLSIAGRARAAAASGRAPGARAHYSELLANLAGADEDSALVREARAVLEQVDTRAPWWVGLFASTGGLMIVGAVVVAIVAGAIVVRRGRKRPPPKKMGPRERAHRRN